MAHVGAVIKAGFFPCPLPVVQLIGSMIKPTSPESCTILDPCCGEGEAVAELARVMGVPTSNVWAIELEENRSEKAKARMPDAHVLGPGDFFSSSVESGFSVVWCNPPFADEVGGGQRMEYSFLRRAVMLAGAGGVVVFICPESVVGGGYADCPRYLLEELEDLIVFPFPDGHRKFKEVVAIGKVREKSVQFADLYGAWRSVLRPRTQHFRAPARTAPRWFNKTGYTEAELAKVISQSPLWEITTIAPVRKLPRPPLPVSKGHLALLLASGKLNGVVRKDGELPHVVRGTAQKIKLEPEVEDKLDRDGNVTGTVTTIKESIKLTVRAVDHRGKIVTFADGTEPEKVEKPKPKMREMTEDEMVAACTCHHPGNSVPCRTCGNPYVEDEDL